MSNWFKEIEKVSRLTAQEHGVKRKAVPAGAQFKAMGVSSKTGRKTLACPNMCDIYLRQEDGVCVFVTAGHYFDMPTTVTTREGFLTEVSQLIENQEPGYYIVNHGNRRAKFISDSWDETVSYLDGKYVGDDTFNAIQDTPTDMAKYRASMEVRLYS